MLPAFQDAGQKEGLEIWRIENFTAVRYPTNDYGKFFTGDSYIVLSTRGVVSLRWDIHFWLGYETTNDESGTAAIMSVQLDDHLGGGPIQHREVQEHESPLFLSYFPSGIRYLTGGIASGFHHIERDAVTKRLFQVKGKRNVRVRQVELNVSSMNKGDCFILDVAKSIYIYVGHNSKRLERIKAISAANQIRDQDHSGKSSIIILDESTTDLEVRSFFKELGSGSSADVVEEIEDDEEFERRLDSTVTLWKVSDASGSLQMTKVGEKSMDQTLLDPDDSFILDTVTSGIFVWIGKNANTAEKLEAMNRAQQFLTDNNYPQWTQIKRIVQEGEPPDFKQYFNNWRAVGDLTGPGRYRREAIVASLPKTEVQDEQRILELAKSGGKSFSFMPDDGSGVAETFVIDQFRLSPIDEATYGMFFGGDSYVIKYTYKSNGKDNYIIYYWQGDESTQDDKAASAFHTVRLDNELNGKAMQIRVTQGNEPRHFLQIYKGKMILFKSGHHNSETIATQSTRLFQVRGTCDYDVRAVQVSHVATSLSSDDVFLLETLDTAYLWIGRGASNDEKEVAFIAIKRLVSNKEVIVVAEGKEPNAFWVALGGKSAYNTIIDNGSPVNEPRLFHCHLKANGKFRVGEIKQYKQDDLDEDDIMILDSGEEVYVWVGSKTTDNEKKGSTEMAEKYIKSDPSNRKPEYTLIFTVKQGEEPMSFMSLFPKWI